MKEGVFCDGNSIDLLNKTEGRQLFPKPSEHSENRFVRRNINFSAYDKISGEPLRVSGLPSDGSWEESGYTGKRLKDDFWKPGTRLSLPPALAILEPDVSPLRTQNVQAYRAFRPAAGAHARRHAAGIAETISYYGIPPTVLAEVCPSQATTMELYNSFEFGGSLARVLLCCWSPTPGYHPLPGAIHGLLERLYNTGGPNSLGCLIVCAAGNHGAPLSSPEWDQVWRHPKVGCTRTRGQFHNGYAAHPGVLVVGACNSQGKRSRYSNWGTGLSLAAPSDDWDPLEGPPVNAPFGGTSRAAARVAAAAWKILTQYPELTATRLKELLTAGPWEPQLGHGCLSEPQFLEVRT